MKTFIINLFKIENTKTKGLLWAEWAVIAYLVITTFVILFAYTKIENPQSMLWGRFRIGVIIGALWLVYKLVPCKITMLARVITQFLLLSWWYPDTYEINKIFPNLDHIFAMCEQYIFGWQPALTFYKLMPSPIISELMSMGYFAYYPMMLVVVLCYFFLDYKNFTRSAFVLIASFMTYYLIYDFVPVVGPTFYFKAIGIENATKGFFPEMGHYFSNNTECLKTPGYSQGFFYKLVESAKQAGERPTAAFPSSHVGVSTICMMLLCRLKNKTFFYVLTPIFVFLCMATVYIQAHYVIDTIAGLATAILFYIIFWNYSKIRRYLKTA